MSEDLHAVIPPTHEPRNVGLLVDQGWAQFSAQDLEGAEQSFRQAIALDRYAFEAHYGLGVVLKKKGEMAAAHQVFIQAQRCLASFNTPRDHHTIIRQLLRWYLEGTSTSGEQRDLEVMS